MIIIEFISNLPSLIKEDHALQTIIQAHGVYYDYCQHKLAIIYKKYVLYLDLYLHLHIFMKS